MTTPIDILAALRTFRSPQPAEYPELIGYSRERIYDQTIGPGALYLAARMAREMGLQAGQVVLDCREAPDADALNEDQVLFEHEHGIDPFDVAISLEQIAWNRDHRPRKTLFTLTARR